MNVRRLTLNLVLAIVFILFYGVTPSVRSQQSGTSREEQTSSSEKSRNSSSSKTEDTEEEESDPEATEDEETGAETETKKPQKGKSTTKKKPVGKEEEQKGTSEEKQTKPKTKDEKDKKPAQVEVLLFNLGWEFIDDLNSSRFSDRMSKEFALHGVQLSEDTTVSISERGKEWVLRDGRRLFVIRKEGLKLNVYRGVGDLRKVTRPDFGIEPLDELKPFGYEFFSEAPSTFAPAAETPVPLNYSLGPGDRLKVRFWSPVRKETTYDLTVNPDGQVYIPVVGLLTLSGMGFDASRKLISDSLTKYYRNVEVDVTLSKLRTLRVFVAGEAMRPGGYTVSALSTAFNVLYLAGGPSERGSMRNIHVSRNGREVGTIDLYRYLLTGDRKVDIDLQQGDTLFIPVRGPQVAVYGEVKRPALYELTGGERLRDALELAGGPLSTSLLARVQLDRVEGNVRRSIVNVDLSATYNRDDDKNNPVLLDGDAIGLFPVPERRTGSVQVEGPVQKPGVFQLREGMRVSDLVADALGLRNDVEVYLQRANVIRIMPDTRIQVLPVDLAAALRKDPPQDLVLKEFDKLVIFEREQVPYQGYVEVQGNVERPGLYQRTVGMKVSDLLFLSGMPRVNTYRERADLTRTNPDESQTILAVNLSKLDAQDADSDIELRDRDLLKVYTIEQADAQWNFRWVKIDGAVQRPGQFPRQENMTLKDLIFAAGGLLPDAASEAEIARPSDDNRTLILTSDLRALFDKNDDRQNVFLADRDRVLVKRREEYAVEPVTVELSGEFRFPGIYSMNGRREKLSSLFQRAGGLTEEAFPEGAVFTRQADKLTVPEQQTQADKVKADMEAATKKKFEGWALANKPGAISQTTTAPGAPQQTIEAASSAEPGKAFVSARTLGEVVSTPRIAIDLTKIVDPDNRTFDVYLEEGDRLYIPKKPTTVITAGAVVNPGPILFEGEQRVSFYVARSGGYAADAEPSRAVIVRSNGLVDPAKKSSRLKLGDILIVPTKPMIYQQPKSWLQSFGEIMSVVSSTATTAYVLTQIGK